jgi:uncharacterized membrane protein YczE
VPTTPWSSRGSRWTAGPLTLAVLVVGLWIFGTGEAALVEAGLGVSPWVVLSEGVSEQVGISIGTATFAVSVAIVLLWPLLRERPGLGTLANAVVIAVAIDVMSAVLPTPQRWPLQVLQVLAGIAAVGIGSGLYLTSNVGPGPRDGLMTGLHRVLDQPVARVRLGIEVCAVAAGWLLGGTVGAGTVTFALLIGYSVSLGLAVVSGRG